VKFLCDRCNTRYSIGDDRVRGKILKIRCKSCANVITVREGMPDPDAAPPEPQTVAAAAPRRPQKTTTAAPAIQSEALAPPRAAKGPKPPPALEEEWYVSIEGEQSGPFSLGDAQRWIASQPFDADLHCWSEGFDDWLPVDKVSHFRGLRKKPAPTAPPMPAAAPAPAAGAPPVPRAALAARPAARPPSEDEPKPLFAATMAAIEKGSAPSDLRALGGAPAGARDSVPPAAAGPAASSAGLGAAVATPASPAALRGLGAPATKPLDLRTMPSAGAPRPAATPANGLAPGRANGAALGAKAPALAEKSRGPVHAATQPGVGLSPPPPAAAFDGEGNDASTQIEAPAFEPATAGGAAAVRDMFADLRPGPVADLAAEARGLAAAATALEPASSPAAGPTALGLVGGGSADDDLEIGEVSRVVKLADLAKAAGAAPVAQPAAAAAPPRAAGAAMNRTGPVPRLGAAGAATLGTLGTLGDLDAPLAVPGAAAEPAPTAVSHRRGMIALLAGAAVLVGVAVGVVILFVRSGDDRTSRLGRVDDIDTTRPDEVRRAGGSGSAATGSADATAGKPADPTGPLNPVKRPVTPPGTPPGTPVLPPEATGAKLEAREIEDMAAKNAPTTQRCYMRAQRGVDGILTAEVKKIAVTLTVSADGTVTDVGLSDKQEENSLGKCLLTTIKAWKFRPSPGGTFRFLLYFN
jgi:predicted Zn finger-like uncharacterized protein